MKNLHFVQTLALFLTTAAIVHGQANDIFAAELTVYTIIQRFEFFLWALAVAAFFWGLVKFMMNAGDTSEHEKGKELIVWGLISFVVLVSIWGIVQLIAGDTFGYTSGPIQFIDKNGGAS